VPRTDKRLGERGAADVNEDKEGERERCLQPFVRVGEMSQHKRINTIRKSGDVVKGVVKRTDVGTSRSDRRRRPKEGKVLHNELADKAMRGGPLVAWLPRSIKPISSPPAERKEAINISERG